VAGHPPTRFVVVEPTTDPRWSALARTAGGRLFHSAPWLRTLQDTYSIEVKALLVLDANENVRGGILYTELDGALGARVVSLPFTDACDPLYRDSQAWGEMLGHFAAGNKPIYLRCLDDRVKFDRLKVVKRARWHTLSVIDQEDVLFKRFGSSARRGIRKALRGGVEVRPLDGAKGVSDFHHMHVRVRKTKYRLLAQPVKFFQSMRRRFEEAGAWFPLGAFIEDRLVAATIFLRWNDTLYYKFNTSRLDDLTLRPNNLLVWEGIKLARSIGCTTMDLGPSDDDQPGLIRFKHQFGAEERELRFLSHGPLNSPNVNATMYRRLLGGMTRVLTLPYVPDRLTDRAGALLYRFFA
jgi:CelD/BcsL family acetyltransferase involved in cellulose biosynthesis